MAKDIRWEEKWWVKIHYINLILKDAGLPGLLRILNEPIRPLSGMKYNFCSLCKTKTRLAWVFEFDDYHNECFGEVLKTGKVKFLMKDQTQVGPEKFYEIWLKHRDEINRLSAWLQI